MVSIYRAILAALFAIGLTIPIAAPRVTAAPKDDSTVRLAPSDTGDTHGHVLIAKGGRYAHLFSLQAEGYL